MANEAISTRAALKSMGVNVVPHPLHAKCRDLKIRYADIAKFTGVSVGAIGTLLLGYRAMPECFESKLSGLVQSVERAKGAKHA
jgi:hypothetical protein